MVRASPQIKAPAKRGPELAPFSTGLEGVFTLWEREREVGCTQVRCGVRGPGFVAGRQVEEGGCKEVVQRKDLEEQQAEMGPPASLRPALRRSRGHQTRRAARPGAVGSGQGQELRSTSPGCC